MAPRWWAMLGGQPGWRVADVGCGPGVFALRYAEWVGPTGLALGVDIAPEALARAEAKRDPARHAALRLVLLDAEREPLPARGLDAILLTHVLHHAEEPRAMLRLLRPAGARLLVAEFDPTGPGEVGPPPAARLGPDALAAMLREAGWAPEPPVAMGDETYAISSR